MITVNLRAKTYLSTEVIHLYRVKNLSRKASHLMFPQFMDDNNEKERDLAIFMDIILMGKCQEVWVLGDVISKGMNIEIEKAKKRRQQIRYFNKDFEEVDSL